MPAQAGMQKILVLWIPACAGMPTLHLCEHLVGATHFEFSRRFEIELLDHAVFDQQRVTLRAHAHAARGEVGLDTQKSDVSI